VPVDDVEEFFAKVQQVAAANAKAVIASTASFQSGSRAFAESKGIGLMRYFDPSCFKWELLRSPSASAQSTSSKDRHLVEAGLYVQDFQSQGFDLYFQSHKRETNSLWDFFEDLSDGFGLTQSLLRKVKNLSGRVISEVRFYEKDQLEAIATSLLYEMGYTGGLFDLDSLCERESKRVGLVVNQHASIDTKELKNPPLDRIQFEPLVIDIYAQESSNPGRDRFTLAHELAHHLLDHKKYLVQESCENSDFSLHRRSLIDGGDIARMEFQANYLAASMLLPKEYVLQDFKKFASELGLIDKGFGHLYVDDQPCNQQNYRYITGGLMSKFGVSRSAVTIRLETMGLLYDARRNAFQSLPRAIDNTFQV
jgi:Zn-dependent peptidase ImmA (M78 family)